MSEPIFHLTALEDWALARASGAYEMSTRGRTLIQEGYIHAATAAQVPGVRSRFFSDLSESLLLLQIDPDRLTSPLVWEADDPATGEEFPHIYGPLNLDAIVRTSEVRPPHA